MVMSLDVVLVDTLRAVSICCCWFCVLFKMTAFDRLQKLVRVIFEIIVDPNFTSFMIIQLLVTIGFALAFYLILRNTDPMMNGKCHIMLR